jgi:hypothetical protein
MSEDMLLKCQIDPSVLLHTLQGNSTRRTFSSAGITWMGILMWIAVHPWASILWRVGYHFWWWFLLYFRPLRQYLHASKDCCRYRERPSAYPPTSFGILWRVAIGQGVLRCRTMWFCRIDRDIVGREYWSANRHTALLRYVPPPSKRTATPRPTPRGECEGEEGEDFTGDWPLPI